MAETLTSKTTEFSGGVTGSLPLHLDSATSYLYPLVQLIPTELGGCTSYHLAAAETTNATTVKAAAGQVYGFTLFHIDDAPVYVTFYDVATTPTPDTTVIKMKFGVPVGIGTAAPADGSERSVYFNHGIVFSSGISIAIHKGIGTSVAAAASKVLFTMWYK